HLPRPGRSGRSPAPHRAAPGAPDVGGRDGPVGWSSGSGACWGVAEWKGSGLWSRGLQVRVLPPQPLESRQPGEGNVADNVLSADTRTATGKGANRKLRVAGRIPAVVYGKGRDTLSVALDPKVLETLLHKSGAGLNTLIDLSVAGRTDTVLVKELQRHPVHGS